MSNEQPNNEYAYLAFHPKNILLVLLLIGLSTIFVALSIAYVYNRVHQQLPPLRLPILFLFNTLILLGSSSTMVWAKKSYLADHTENYQKALWYTLGLSLLFMLFFLFKLIRLIFFRWFSWLIFTCKILNLLKIECLLS